MEMTRPLDFGGHPGLHRYNFSTRTEEIPFKARAYVST